LNAHVFWLRLRPAASLKPQCISGCTTGFAPSPPCPWRRVHTTLQPWSALVPAEAEDASAPGVLGPRWDRLASFPACIDIERHCGVSAIFMASAARARATGAGRHWTLQVQPVGRSSVGTRHGVPLRPQEQIWPGARVRFHESFAGLVRRRVLWGGVRNGISPGPRLTSAGPHARILSEVFHVEREMRPWWRSAGWGVDWTH
jgi:hypothetical protein